MTTNGLKTDISLDSWQAVSDFTDSLLHVPAWLFETIAQHGAVYPKHAFSKGQLSSKAWMLDQLNQHAPSKSINTVAVLGCWIGTLIPFLHSQFSIQRVYGFDLDPHSIDLSEQLNQRYVQDSWRYKGVVADVSQLCSCDMQFETANELINVTPDWLINTSCEHMNTDWFHTADSSQLIIMQTNNSADYEGHINICNSIEEMQQKYPLQQCLFKGSLKTPAYTRFMQIGYK